MMATESKAAPAEDAKIDLFEDDDEFEEFEIDEGNSTLLLFVLGFSLRVLRWILRLDWIGIGIEALWIFRKKRKKKEALWIQI